MPSYPQPSRRASRSLVVDLMCPATLRISRRACTGIARAAASIVSAITARLAGVSSDSSAATAISSAASRPASAILRLMMKSRDAARVLFEKMGFDDAQMDREQAELLDKLAELRARRASQVAPEGVAALVADRSLESATRALARSEALRPTP